MRQHISGKVCHKYLHPGMYHLELENDNIKLMLQATCGDADIADKEMQIIHMEFMRERDAKLNHPDSHSRI